MKAEKFVRKSLKPLINRLFGSKKSQGLRKYSKNLKKS